MLGKLLLLFGRIFKLHVLLYMLVVLVWMRLSFSFVLHVLLFVLWWFVQLSLFCRCGWYFLIFAKHSPLCLVLYVCVLICGVLFCTASLRVAFVEFVGPMCSSCSVLYVIVVCAVVWS